jgi:hypothetical protein
MNYVTYDIAGKLTGAYLQDLLPEHATAHIEVSDAIRLDWTHYRANSARDGVEITPIVPVLPTEADYVSAIQAMLDTKAQERRYYDILSASTYIASTNSTFKAEAGALLAWRDAVWLKAYSVFDQVTAKTIAQPTIAGLLAMLPSMTWPA